MIHHQVWLRFDEDKLLKRKMFKRLNEIPIILQDNYINLSSIVSRK